MWDKTKGMIRKRCLKTSKINKKMAAGIVLSILIVAIAGLYIYYQTVYRGEQEPHTAAIQTNTDPAVYPLAEFKWELSKQRSISDYAFDGQIEEEEYGTYVIPGLKETETLRASWEHEPAICTSMTPQGIVAAEEYLLISAYCHTYEHNSVIYVLNKETHEFVKKIVLKGKPHVGGLAYDPANQMIWLSGKFNGIAQANAFTLQSLEDYQFAWVHSPIKYDKSYELYSIERSSFMTYHNSALYVGCYESGKMSVVERYEIDEKGGLKVKETKKDDKKRKVAIPVETAVISGRVQGMTFYGDKVFLSQSSGFRKSNLVLFQDANKTTTFTNEVSSYHVTLPPQLEQIFVDGDKLYALFESAAYAYRGYMPITIDRVLTLDMEKVFPQSFRKTKK